MRSLLYIVFDAYFAEVFKVGAWERKQFLWECKSCPTTKNKIRYKMSVYAMTFQIDGFVVFDSWRCGTRRDLNLKTNLKKFYNSCLNNILLCGVSNKTKVISTMSHEYEIVWKILNELFLENIKMQAFNQVRAPLEAIECEKIPFANKIFLYD